MCGIGGFRGKLFSKRKETVLENLALGLKSRGEHATGIGFYNGEKSKILKAPTAPSKVAWKTLFDFAPCISDTVIFHNRFATHGKPEINKNNHPFLGEGFMLAHNGVLSNYKTLLLEYGITTEAKEPETDSYALVKILNQLTKTKDMIDALKELCPKVDGSMVLTILCRDGRLILVRGSKYSYKLYRIAGNNYIYASAANIKSQKEHIDIALEPMLLDLYQEVEGNFSIEKIDIPEWSIAIIDKVGNLSFDNFEKPKVVSTASYTSGGYQYRGSNYTGKHNSTSNYYYTGGAQTSLFEDFDPRTGELITKSKTNSKIYINDIMDTIEDSWNKYSNKKFDYQAVRDVVEDEVTGCEDLFSAAVMAEELLHNGALDDLF